MEFGSVDVGKAVSELSVGVLLANRPAIILFLRIEPVIDANISNR